jgi:ribosomal-protein-alanine N-acetyltransferase
MSFNIETERLLLHPFTRDDLPALLSMRSKEEVTRYLGTSALQTPEFIRQRLDAYLECYRLHGFGMMAVREKSGGQLVGWSGIQPLEFGFNATPPQPARETEEIEVGYGFDTPHWGKGYATEAADAWLRYGFEEVGLRRIIAVASPKNAGSRHVMEKLGMRYELTGQYYENECVVYAISRDEFKPRGSFRLLNNSVAE